MGKRIANGHVEMLWGLMQQIISKRILDEILKDLDTMDKEKIPNKEKFRMLSGRLYDYMVWGN